MTPPGTVATARREQQAIVRIIVPSYRERYRANDFANPEARSLDERIARYLSNSTLRARWGSPRKLIFRIAKDAKNVEKESATAEAYRAMFQWKAGAAIRSFMRQLPIVVLLVAVGIFLLWLSFRVEGFPWDEELVKTSSEAIRLGAWVSCWSAISLLFSHGFESVRKFVAYRRLTRMPIEFEYSRSPRSYNEMDGSMALRQV